MSVLLSMPVAFTDSLSRGGALFVVFCATWLGIITILCALIFIWVRPIREEGLFGPLKAVSDRLRDFFALVFSCVIAYVAVFILKDYFKIIRPSVWHTDLHALIVQTDFGFPSGHSTFYAALATALFFINKKAGYVAGSIALIIGTARVISGVHTPMDVIAGYCLGVLVACLVDFAIEAVSKNSKK